MTDTLSSPTPPPPAAGTLQRSGGEGSPGALAAAADGHVRDGIPAAAARSHAPSPGQIWAALWVVYIVWGSTYLAIRITDETVPPLLGSGARFLVAGIALLAVLAARRGLHVLRPRREELLGALVVGTLLPGANAVVSVAELKVPSSVAALLISSVPLWVILLRRLSGDAISGRLLAAVLVGFAGVALVMRPGEQSGDATFVGLAACVFAALMWASGSFASPRLTLPRSPLVSIGWQMLLGGIIITAVGLALGEAGDVEPGALSARSLVALAYLIVVGSWLAYTAYAWLLQNAPISKVATYAYVNPVVAIFLGWLVLDEKVTPVTVAGAAVIVASVAMVVRQESR